jgi:hypothetical protein
VLDHFGFQATAVDGTEAALVAASAARLARLCQDAVHRFALDLSGAKVLTEAASGPFAATPLLAAMAGAQVTAVTRASRWGNVGTIRATIDNMAAQYGLQEWITIHEGAAREVAHGCDIVTNLGMVRPIGRDIISQLSPGAVVALMWEPWEFRPGEIDLGALAEYDVALIGTDESHPDVATLDYLGPAAGRLLLECGIEIAHAKIAIIGSAPFGPTVARWLNGAGAEIVSWQGEAAKDIDAVLLMEHRDPAPLFGSADHDRLAALREGGGVVLHICGTIDRAALQRMGLTIVPPHDAPFGAMTVSTAYAGPRAVVDLHAGGLRAAADVWHAQRRGESVEQALQGAESGGYGLRMKAVIGADQ